MVSQIKRGILALLTTSGLMSKTTRRNFDAYLREYKSDGKVLDIGSGGGPYKELFPNRTSVDILSQDDVDVVADVHELSKHFQEGEFDVVLCTEALEHFYHPHKAIEEIHRVLKPGGILILSTRFIFPLHEVPHDYFRFTEYGLRHLLSTFEIRELVRDGNTIETLAVLYQRIGYQCNTLWLAPFKLFWLVGSKLTLLFSRILTAEYGDVNKQHLVPSIITSGYLVIAQKR